jgi:PilZ domain
MLIHTSVRKLRPVFPERREDAMSEKMADARRPKPDIARTPERDECDFTTILSHGSTLRADGLIVDISPMGCCIRSSHEVNKYDRVRILLPVIGDSKATVAWALRGVFGCAFETPIDQATYSRVLAAIKTGRDDWSNR